MKASRLGLHQCSMNMHRVCRAHCQAANNGAEADLEKPDSSKTSQNSTIKQKGQPTAQQINNVQAKVSDKLKTAVKQVDKRVHEMTAIPVSQNVALAPHMHEYPGEQCVLPLFLTVTAGFAQASDLCRIGFLGCLNLGCACSNVGVKTAPTLPADSHRRHPGYGKLGHAPPTWIALYAEELPEAMQPSCATGAVDYLSRSTPENAAQEIMLPLALPS